MECIGKNALSCAMQPPYFIQVTPSVERRIYRHIFYPPHKIAIVGPLLQMDRLKLP